MENRRTIGITLGREVDVADPGRELSALWPTVRWWLCLPVGDLPAEDDWMGLECASNGDGAEGAVASAATLAALPPGLAYKVAVMRTLNYPFAPEFGQGQRTIGIEAWYAADKDWARAVAEPEWETALPIGFSLWRRSEGTAEAFVHELEATTFLQLALRKRAIRIDVFGTKDNYWVDAPLVELRCDLSVEDDDVAARFQLTYRLPNGELSGLTGSTMSGFGEGMMFDEAQLAGVAQTFLHDAAEDIRREGLDLDYGDGLPPIRVVADSAARQVIDARRRSAAGP